MRTETELKQTWCPMARVATYHRDSWNAETEHIHDPKSPAVNRETGTIDRTRAENRIPGGCFCIGLACSQCVDCGPVVEIGDRIPDDILTPDHDPNKPKGKGWKNKQALLGAKRFQRWERETGERHVYCGQNTGEALRQEVASMPHAQT